MALQEIISINPEVEGCVKEGRPVVALESTLITHGLPRPRNLEVALSLEREVRSQGAQPATIGVLDGKILVGMSEREIDQLASREDVYSIVRQNLASSIALCKSGGTTVATTMCFAHAANIRVFATGGIGGIHPGGSGFISPDLPELARTPVVVVSAGAKYFLDLPKTFYFLESEGVPVLGWKTDEIPAFFSGGSGLPVTARIESAEEAVKIIKTHWEINQHSGVLVTVPCPKEFAVPRDQVEKAREQAEVEARKLGIDGRPLTPFMLRRMAEISNGATLRANQALLEQNARVAAQVAIALSGNKTR